MFKEGATVELFDLQKCSSDLLLIRSAKEYPGSQKGLIQVRGAFLDWDSNRVSEDQALIFKRPNRTNTFLGTYGANEQNYLYNFSYYRVWQKLSKTPLHAIPYMWLAKDNYIAMPDMTTGGGAFYGLTEFYQVYNGIYQPRPQDSQFKAIPLQNIEKEARKIVHSATNLKIRLNNDTFNTLVMQDGSFKVFPLNLSFTMFNFSHPYSENVAGLHHYMKLMAALHKKI